MKINKDTVSRSITAGDETMSVSRFRTSDGFGSITIKVGKESITLTNDADPEYEGKAKRLASLIDGIADNSCKLPGA